MTQLILDLSEPAKRPPTRAQQAHLSFWVPTAQDDPNAVIAVREGTLLRYGKWSDFPAIEALRRKESDALGFVPMQVYEGILQRSDASHLEWRKWQKSNVLVTYDNNELTGFCYVSFASATVRIFQIVIREDARRWHRALLITDAIEEKARATLKTAISCRVATDIESNAFWTAIGFEIKDTVIGTFLNHEAKSKRPLYVYRKSLLAAPTTPRVNVILPAREAVLA